MPVITSGSFLLATVNYTFSGQRYMNTFHYRAIGDGGPFDEGAIITDFHAAFFTGGTSLCTALLGALPDNFQMNQIWYQFISPTRYRKLVYNVDELGLWPVNGTTGNVAAVVSRFGDLAKRWAQGRIFIPISADSDACVGGVITNEMKEKTDLVAFRMGQPIETATPTVTWEPVLMNPNRMPVYTPITVTRSETTVRVMTRRTVGRGI